MEDPDAECENAARLARLEELARLYTERPHTYAAASPEDLQRAADLRWAIVTIARLTAERDTAVDTMQRIATGLERGGAPDTANVVRKYARALAPAPTEPKP